MGLLRPREQASTSPSSMPVNVDRGSKTACAPAKRFRPDSDDFKSATVWTGVADNARASAFISCSVYALLSPLRFVYPRMNALLTQQVG